MGGKSPNVVYAENFVRKRVVTADALDEHLMKPSRPLTVGRNGVRFDYLTYDAPALDAWFGKEVRLRYGYFITAKSVVKNDKGEVVEVHCTYDPATRGGNAPDARSALRRRQR